MWLVKRATLAERAAWALKTRGRLAQERASIPSGSFYQRQSSRWTSLSSHQPTHQLTGSPLPHSNVHFLSWTAIKNMERSPPEARNGRLMTCSHLRAGVRNRGNSDARRRKQADFPAESKIALGPIFNAGKKFSLAASQSERTGEVALADVRSLPRDSRRAALSAMLSAKHADQRIALLCSSTSSHLQRLLTTEEFGDQRPSQSLHRMRQLLGELVPHVDNPILRELLLQRLPQEIRMVLASATDMPLDLRGTDHLPLEEPPPSSTALQDLQLKIDQLTASVAALQPPSGYAGCPSGRSPPNHRNSSRARTPSPPRAQGTCWYHRKYGHPAVVETRQRPLQWLGISVKEEKGGYGGSIWRVSATTITMCLVKRAMLAERAAWALTTRGRLDREGTSIPSGSFYQRQSSRSSYYSFQPSK
ncbi:hypothetical protein HPB47_017301 [Ixodes persulcatus]|uniref:Uncharacterized protein n=1 Tax=Ixodes persulcatus TaxID=34615 RepID=A0AC60QR67_IXOPE|nr:hypothetical protein HPB47_017301 [Ixodes persulcatus]